jgi:hypothetical protein
VLEDLVQIGKPARAEDPAAERRHLDLVEQMAEESGLGQDLDVEEGRGRLELQRRELLAPVELAWRVNVDHRDGEDYLARETE